MQDSGLVSERRPSHGAKVDLLPKKPAAKLSALLSIRSCVSVRKTGLLRFLGLSELPRGGASSRAPYLVRKLTPRLNSCSRPNGVSTSAPSL